MPDAGFQRAEDKGRTAESRWRIPEDRGQRAKGKGQRAKGKGQTADLRLLSSGIRHLDSALCHLESALCPCPPGSQFSPLIHSRSVADLRPPIRTSADRLLLSPHRDPTRLLTCRAVSGCMSVRTKNSSTAVRIAG